MRFYGIPKQDLGDFYTCLNALEMIYRDTENFRPKLYVTINQGAVMELAANAIRDAGTFEEDEPSPRPASIAVSMDLSADGLRSLMGSGYEVTNEEFAYQTENEGVRTESFVYAGGRERVHLNQILTAAISEDDTWLGEFYEAHAPQSPVQPSEPIVRNEPSTESSLKKGSVKGIDRVLLSDKSFGELKVTEIIEIEDFVSANPKGAYLYSEDSGKEWLVFSKTPKEGEAALRRVMNFKYDVEDPSVETLSADEVLTILHEAHK